MKLLCLLILVLCLAGCAPEAQEMPAEPGLYQEHLIEAQTKGAVRVFPLGEYDCQALVPMGRDYLLFSEDSLTLLSGENLTPVVTVPAPGLPLPGSGQVQVTANGVGYFSEKEQTVVFLGSTLLEVGRLHLAAEITGPACLSPAWDKLYYCVDGDIRCLDLRTGTTQILKKMGEGRHRILGVELQGQYLRVRTQMADGTYTYSFISAQTGETVDTGNHFREFLTTGERYYLQRQLGTVRECVAGQGETAVALFLGAEDKMYPLPEIGGWLRVRAGDTQTVLEYFDLSSGKRTGAITLAGITGAEGFCADGQTIWFCWQNMLLQWDPAASPTGEETQYTQPYYTRENPDIQGLEEVGKTVTALEDRWGVEILWQEEPASVVPWEGYTFETEYIPQVYAATLQQLAAAMEHFPRDFFIQAAQWTEKPLQIVLVRGIYGAREKGTVSTAPCIQYQMEGKTYLAISMAAQVDRAFYHGVSHLVETRILSTCTAYYEWNTLNPQGFQYDNNYITNQNRQDDQYLRPEDRSFIDMYAMSFAIEDRARILEYACLPGNEGYFTSATMQEKLSRICKGLREAFSLPEGSCLWEQYLK